MTKTRGTKPVWASFKELYVKVREAYTANSLPLVPATRGDPRGISSRLEFSPRSQHSH